MQEVKLDLNEVLIQAAKDGNMLVLKAALDKGADINAKDENGKTALMYAEENGHIEIVDFLKEKEGIEYEISLHPVQINGKYGYVDESGRVVINLQFDYADLFREGLALVRIGGKWGYIDKTGRVVRWKD